MAKFIDSAAKYGIYIFWAIVALILVASLVVFGLNQAFPQSSNDNNSGAKTYTFDTVAVHNSAQDCWIIIGSKVYEVSTYIPAHPGGDEIVPFCGKDATQAFNSRTSVGGSPHPNNAVRLLDNYLIGELDTSTVASNDNGDVAGVSSISESSLSFVDARNIMLNEFPGIQIYKLKKEDSGYEVEFELEGVEGKAEINLQGVIVGFELDTKDKD